ncbi:hypothetical protein HY642_02775 [Candidatus Woesearchaeota archaeon]|nr:hypothetical protein [Candidatus Woesearchaeota archaeon]
MPKLTLLGIDPEDFRGEERLELKLAKLKPDVIAIESSPAALEYHRQWYEQDDRELHEWLVDKRFKNFSAEVMHVLLAGELHRSPTPYAWSVANAYAETKGVKVYPVGSDEGAKHEYLHECRQRKLGRGYVQRLLRLVDTIPDGETETGRVLGNELFTAALDVWCSKYATVAHLMDARPGKLKAVLSDCRWMLGQPDAHMDAEVRDVLNSDRRLKGKASHLVVIAQYQRLLPYKETLYSKLEDWTPQRKMLYEPLRKVRHSRGDARAKKTAPTLPQSPSQAGLPQNPPPNNDAQPTAGTQAGHQRQDDAF